MMSPGLKKISNRTRIDLHNHTILSDGDLDLMQICTLKKNYLDVLCITDHYHPKNPNAYYRAKTLKKKYEKYKTNDLPIVIIGIEYTLRNTDNMHILIFGDHAIREVIKYKPCDERELYKVIKNNFAATIICHPLDKEIFGNDYLLTMADGIEVSLRGVYLEKHEKYFKTIKRKHGLKLLSNSDFHSGWIGVADTYNIFHTGIHDVENLIKAMKDKVLVENVFGERYELVEYL